MMPYLVRSMAGFEATGHYFVGICGDVLDVEHGSLGRSRPKASHVPLVIFLERAPQRVHAAWGVAE